MLLIKAIIVVWVRTAAASTAFLCWQLYDVCFLDGPRSWHRADAVVLCDFCRPLEPVIVAGSGRKFVVGGKAARMSERSVDGRDAHDELTVAAAA